MNILQAIRERRAVRDYKPDPVSAGMIYQLMTSASWAPSAMNEQPCRFTVVTDSALLDEISAKSKAATLANMSAMLRPNHFRDILGDPGFHIFYHAPVLIVISATGDGQWYVEDCALAAQNLMLSAYALGLGSCWVGFAQGWLNTLEGHRALGLPTGDRAVAPIIVGHPTVLPPPVARKAIAISWIGDIMPTEEHSD